MKSCVSYIIPNPAQSLRLSCGQQQIKSTFAVTDTNETVEKKCKEE